MMKKIFFVLCAILSLSCSLKAEPNTLVSCKTDADCQKFVASDENIYRKCARADKAGKLLDTQKCVTKTIGFGTAGRRTISYCQCTSGTGKGEPLTKFSECNAKVRCSDV